MRQFVAFVILSCPLLSSSVFAQAAGAKPGFDFLQFLPIIAIFGIFYFLVIRPQQKKMKKHREMLSNIRRGDRVVTAGGIIGTISKVENDDELLVDIGSDVVVRVVRTTVTHVIDKTAPVSSISNGNELKAVPAKKTPAKKPFAGSKKTK